MAVVNLFDKKSLKKEIPSDAFYQPNDAVKPKATRKHAKPAALRASITPGTVLILLAGRFRGKRVVFLKQLDSGLLLVSGPFKINGVPLRRVDQAYVIATSTKIDIGSVSVPAEINDAYFTKEKKGKSAEKQFFGDAEKTPYPADKAATQKSIDSALLAEIKKTPVLAKYLSASFGLSKGQYPHLLKF